MSFHDWVKEANNSNVYISLKSKVVSPNSGKIKLIKYEQEDICVSEKSIAFKKQLFSNKINFSEDRLYLDNLTAISCRESLNNLEQENNEKSSLEIIQEKIIKKHLKDGIKCIKECYKTNKSNNIENNNKKKRGRPKKVNL